MQQDISVRSKTNSLIVDDRPISSSILVKFGPRNKEPSGESALPPKFGGENVLNRQYLSRTLLDCREIWHDDVAQDYGGWIIVLKPTFSQNQNCRDSDSTPISVRNSNSTFYPTCR